MKHFKKILGLALVFSLLLFIPNTTTFAKNKNAIEITKEYFGNDDTIETITLSKDVINVRDGAFSNLKNLKEIKVDKNNTHYASHKGCLYTKDYEQLVCIPQKIGNITLKKSLKYYWIHSLDGLPSEREQKVRNYLKNKNAMEIYGVYYLSEEEIYGTETDFLTDIEEDTQTDTQTTGVSGPSVTSSTDFSQYVYINSEGKKVFKYTGTGDTAIIIPDGVEELQGFTENKQWGQFNDTITYIYIPASVNTMYYSPVFSTPTNPDDNWYYNLYQCRNLQTVETEEGGSYRSDGNTLYGYKNRVIWSRDSKVPATKLVRR